MREPARAHLMAVLKRAVAGFAIGIALLLALAGTHNGPFYAIPGGVLSGTVDEEPVTDWSFVTDRNLDLETRPDAPYSVELNYVVQNGQLFIDPAEGRAWLDHMRANPLVRVRFGDQIYPLLAVLVGRPGEMEGFPGDRYVYRLDPRE